MNIKSLFFIVILLIYSGNVFSQSLKGNCIAAPELSISGKRTVTVDSMQALYEAVNTAAENTTIFIKPGVYRLTAAISVTTNNLTIRGRENRCDKVVLTGRGMDNENHQGVTSGFWINARNTTIANMTISEIYHHPIQIRGTSEAPRIYNVRMVNAGQQFVKSNPSSSGQGVNNGIVEYSTMEYTDGTPKTDHDGAGLGYTNGVDVHGGSGWRISNNRFLHFHTPDNADHLWNPAILMWRGSSNTIAENNLFFNVDRAIAFGLNENNGDHTGGVIRNNLVFMSPGLMSRSRSWHGDAAIVVWDSPGTKLLHNTILTNNNIPYAIELRFNSTGVVLRNNLTDVPIVNSSAGRARRAVCKFSSLCRNYTLAYAETNEMAANSVWFADPLNGDLRLHEKVRQQVRPLPQHPDAMLDFYGKRRPAAATPGAVQTGLSN